MSFAPTNGRTRSTNGNGIRIIIVMSAADELLQNALAVFRGGQLESALALYEQALALDPVNFTALYA